MLKSTSTFFACVALGLLGIFATSMAKADPIPSNATLPDGSPGFNLLGLNPGPPETNPGPPEMQFVIGFNPQKPPNPNTPTIDLADSGNPLIDNPAAGTGFSIFWGMVNPGPIQLPAVQFTLPTDANGAFVPPNPCTGVAATNSFCYGFSASDGTNVFDISLTITGSTPMDTGSWVSYNPGPPDLPAVQFNFDFMAPADPTLSFLVYENGQQLNFSPVSPVPEPQTYVMLLAGLGLTGFMVRRKANDNFYDGRFLG